MAVPVPDDLFKDQSGVLAKYEGGAPASQPAAFEDKSGVLSKYGIEIPDLAKEPTGGGFMASVKSTIGGTIKGAGQIAEDYIPGVTKDNALKRYGQEVIDANPTAVQSLGDVVDKPGTLVTESVGNVVPSVGAMLGIRAAGQGITAAAPLTGPFAPVTALAGQAVSWGGPALYAALSPYGGIRERQQTNFPDDPDSVRNKLLATVGAGAVGAIETAFGPEKLAKLLTSEAGRKQVADWFASPNLAGRVLKGGLKTGAIEGAEEIVQSPIEQLTGGDDPTTKQSLEETALGGISGFVGGGVLGGGAGAVFGRPAGPISRAADIAKGSGAAPPGGAPAPLPGPETPAPPAEPIPENQPQLFGFTQKGAETRARLLGMQGSPQTIIPHPIHEGRFSVIPDNFSTATDTAGKIEALLEQTETVINAMPAGRPATAGVAAWLAEHQDQLEKLRKTKIAEEEDSQRVEAARAAKDRVNAPMTYVPGGTQPLLPAPEPGTLAGQEPGDTEPKYTGEKVDGKVHPQVGPFKLILENQAGSVRRSKPGALTQWARKVTAHYGYFRGVPARAPDKERVDTFVKPGTTEDHAGPAFVIDQNNEGGAFDEPKVFLGWNTPQDAMAAYLENYPRSQRARIAGVTELSTIELRDRLNNPNAFMQPQPDSVPAAQVNTILAEGSPDAGGAHASLAGNGGEALADQESGDRGGNVPSVPAAGEVAGGNTVSRENTMNGAPANTEVIADSGEAPTLLSELQRIAKGPLARTPVDTAVAGLSRDHQILRGIVQAIPVDVMNNIPSGERTPEHLLRNEAVLKSLAAYTTNLQTDEPVAGAPESSGMPSGDGASHGESIEEDQAEKEPEAPAPSPEKPADEGLSDAELDKMLEEAAAAERGEEPVADEEPAADETTEKPPADQTTELETGPDSEWMRPGAVVLVYHQKWDISELPYRFRPDHSRPPQRGTIKTVTDRGAWVQTETSSSHYGFESIVPFSADKLGPPKKTEPTHKEKLDQERTFLIVRLDDAIKEARKRAEDKPLSVHAQDALRLERIRRAVASETAGAMAQGRDALEAIKAGKPVKEWNPPGLTPRQKEDIRKANEEKRTQLTREYERDLFATALASEPVMQLSQLGEMKFMEQAPEIIGRRVKELLKNAEDPNAKAVLEGMLDGNKAKLPDKFLKSLYNQSRDRFKELEKQKHRDPAKYQAAYEKAAIDANVGDTPEMRAAFKDGFDHALKGKTKSTITGNLPGVVHAGYDAAREWMKTDEGRYFFDGKRGEKEKSTGEELRRHWELVKKGLDEIDASDMTKAWERVKRSTVRADAFPVTLAEDATPGAKAWMGEFREGLATFSEYFVSRAANGVHGREAESIFKGESRYRSGEFKDLERDDDAQRLAKTVEMARDYLTVMNDLANRFTGMKSLAEIEPVLKELFGNDYPALRDRPFVKTNEHLFAAPLYHRSAHSYLLPWSGAQSKHHGARWRELVKTENDATQFADTRAKPLVRPRLDVIERGGMAYDRKGRNITAEEFKHTFKFADVTIGRYVTSEQAQDHLNYAYDALLDLSEILGARPEQLSFGGKLHFAIGALGHGKAAAHFNPAHPLASGGAVPVINVTNTHGDGSVLHEYFHAIDFLTRDQATIDAIQEVKNALKRTPKSPDEVIEIARGFLMRGRKFTQMGRGATPLDHANYALQTWYARFDHASDKTQFFKNAETLDQGKAEPYWSNDYEPWARAAESWGFDLLRDKPARSDYLVSPGWVGDGILKPPAYRGIPYPEGGERKAFNAIMQEFLDQLEWTDNGPRLKDNSPWREGKTPMKARQDAFHAARKDAVARLKELQAMFEAEEQEKIRTRKEEAQKKKDEQLFGKQEEEPPATLDPAPSPNDTGPLSDAELDTMLADAAAIERESIQEKPEVPGLGVPEDAPATPSAPSAEDPTAAQLIKAAAAEGVKGIDETLKALTKLFGGGKIQSFPGGFDKDAYEQAKPHFEAALKAFTAAGKTLMDFFRLLIKQFGEGVIPYAKEFAKEKKLGANLTGNPAETPDAPKQPDKHPEAPEADPARPIANWVQMRLEHAQPFDWRDLFATADNAYGGTQAQGKYAVKDAYDAMELGVNQYLLTQPSFLKEGPRSAIAALDRILNLLPTQTKRTLEQDEFQQFSTPPTHAFLANWVANVHKGESYLEPSAGIGGLGVFGKNAGARVTVNELSARRLALLHALPFDRFLGENAEHLNSILPADIKPTVIVMNPPFSSTAGRIPGERDTMNGAKHIEEALKRLEPGGRLVAIVGEGMADDRPAFKMWWGKIKKDYTVRANIGIDGKAYVKYGTSFGNQILVIDKIGAHSGAETVTGQVATPAEAIPLLEAVRVSRTQPAASTEGTAPGGPQAGVPGGPGAVPQGPGAGPAGLPGSGTAPGVGTGGTSGPRSGPAGGGGGVPGGSKQPPDGRPGGGRGGNTSGQPGGRPGRTPAGTDPGDEPPAGRPEDLGSGAQSPLVVESAADAEAAGGEINNSTFENYTPKKVRIEGAHAHVTPLVESAALSSVFPPDVTYRPHLAPSVITEGKLSLAQLEAVVYAGQAHSQMLVDGKTRRGHFIGDGTGVGKGREISGIILDNWNQGRKRHIWFSEKEHLLASAQRDFKNTGGNPDLIHAHYDYGHGDKIELKEGILFSTYSLLRGESDARKAAKAVGTAPAGQGVIRFERNQQILDWLGKDFDGVIAFDESHNMANSLDTPGSRGVKEAAQQALAAVELQRILPNARIEYISATGATEIENLAYAERLGMWGAGTPFSNFAEFTSQLGRNVTIMELVAQNMKQLGLYNARSLSYNGGTPETTVVYEKLEHQLTDYQMEVYDELAGGWEIVLNNINDALQLTGVTGASGAPAGSGGGQIRGRLMSQFFGTMQRFFNQVITAMQMPSVFDQVDEDLKSGKSVVFQLVNTQGADLEKALGGRKAKRLKAGEEAEEIAEIDLSPREGLIAFLMKAFPVKLYQMQTDMNGNQVLTLVLDSNGDPVLNPEAVAARDKMVKMIRHQLRIPEGVLQQITQKFGPEGFAEVTGRTQRLVPGPKGGQILEKRSKKDVAADIKAFEDGKKRVLAFNNAGGTGVSFHADKTFKNQQRRSHYIVQTDWSANKVVQATGRTHRTNQAWAPIYHLVTTDVPAQKRFITSVARRLEQLGALTAGQRDTAGGGSLFTAADNLESEYATRAVRQFFTNLVNRNISAGGYANLVARDVVTGMGLPNLIDQTGGLNESALPPIPQFLNRMLALRIAMQKEVFKLFSDELDMQIEVAKRDGRFDDGLRTINHVGAQAVAENVVYQDDKTNASTKHFEIAVKQKNRFYDFDDVEAVLNASSKSGWFKNKQSGRVQGVWATASMRTDRSGTIQQVYGIYRTSGATYETADKLDNKNLERLTIAQAKALWEAENAKRPTETVHTTHMVVGSMLPIWNRFNNDHVDVARIKLDDGRRLLGRVIAERDIDETLGRLNVKSAAAQMTGDAIIKEVMAGKTVRMSNSWQIKRSLVSGQPRVEITNFGFPSRAMQTRMAAAGAFFEKIEHNERLFVPTTGGAVLDKLMEQFSMNPVAVETPGTTRLSLAPRPDGAGGQAGIRGQSPEALRAELTKRLGRVPNDVTIVRHWTDLPPELAGEILASGDYHAQGLHDPRTDKVYLVSSNIPSGYGLSVYLHEAGVHQGLKAFIGESSFNRLSRQIYDWADSKADTEEVRLAKRAAARIPSDLGSIEYAEELVAYFVEEAVRAGHDIQEKSTIGEWLRQLAAAIASALKKLTTGRTADLTARDIVALARGAAERSTTRRNATMFSLKPPSNGFRAAIDRLLREKSGEARGALFNLDVGPIDLVWGTEGTADKDFSDGYGLAHIIHKHPEVEPHDLERIVASARKTAQHGNSVELETLDHRAVVKLDWQGQQKKWLLTAFEMRPAGTGERIGVTRSAESAPLADQEADRRKNDITGGDRSGDPTKFSLAAADEPTRAAVGVRDRVASALRDMGPSTLADDEGVLNLWNKTVGTPELIARKNEAFRKVFLEGQAYLGDINRSIGESEKMLGSWFQGQDVLARWWDRVRGREVAKAAKATRALLDGTLDNKVFTAEELAARGLSPKEIEMYEDARIAIDAILAKTGAALINKIAPQYGPVAERLVRIFRDHGLQGVEEFTQYSERVGKARIHRLQNEMGRANNVTMRDILKNRLKVERTNLEEWKKVVQSVARIDKLQREGYFPLSRYGTHYVSVTDPRGQAVEFRMYESDVLARKGAYQLSRRYPQYETKRGTISQNTNELYSGMTPEAVELFAEITGHDQDEAMQLYLKEAVVNRSALKRMIHRKGTEGYSDDAVRVLADFVSVNARHQSRLAHASNLTEFTRDIRGGALRDYAIKMVQYLRGDDGREEYHSIRGFLFFQYIGGNISSALLNLTQVPMFTLPWLTQHTSTANAGKVLTGAYQLALSTEPEQMTGELGEAMRRAEAEELTDPQNVYTTMAIGSGSKLARIGAFTGLLDKWAFFFSRAERLNRRVTFIAAHQVAQANPGALKPGQSAYDFAKEAVNDTQLIYNKGNRPVWARGIGSMPFTFKLFTIGMLENIFARMPRNQMLMILGLLMLAAGAEGLPFAEDLEDVLDTIGQKLGYATSTKKLKKEALDKALQDFLGLPRDTALHVSEMVRKGVFAGTPLETIGRRVGMGNLIPGSSAFLTGRDAAGEIVEAAGPLASFARNVGSAAELATRGEFGRAAEKVLPTGLANIQKGLRQAGEGVETNQFGGRVADVPAEQAALQTIGISSANVARSRERDQILKQNEDYLKVVKDRIADKWAQAIVNRDLEAQAEARDELREHNERNPDQKIRISPINIQSRVRGLRLTPEQRSLRGVALERRAEAREFLAQ